MYFSHLHFDKTMYQTCYDNAFEQLVSEFFLHLVNSTNFAIFSA